MTDSSPKNDDELTRQELRAEKLRKKKAKIQQHGKGLAKIYKKEKGKGAIYHPRTKILKKATMEFARKSYGYAKKEYTSEEEMQHGMTGCLGSP